MSKPKKATHILLTTDVIHAGGAETFVLRLAQALQQQGRQVVVFPLYSSKVDRSIAATLAPGVKLVTRPIPLIRIVQAIDGLLRRLYVDFSLLDWFFTRAMSAIVKTEQCTVIHSHLFTTDKIAVRVGQHTGATLVTTIHGDYSANDQREQDGKLQRILNFRQHMRTILNSMDAVVCICEEQLQFFGQRQSFFGRQLPLQKIYNGYAKPQIANGPARQQLGIPSDAFVFGMVARGIPEKGWLQTIIAFNKLQEGNSYLLLVGHSDYVQTLKNQYASKRVLFAGQQQQPFGWLQLCNVGLFCSLIRTEALPTVVIEYLAAGLPVIATAVGEVPQMIAINGSPAGMLVSCRAETLVDDLAIAMRKMQFDPDAYAVMQAQTALAYQQFSMDRCVAAYEAVYNRSKTAPGTFAEPLVV